MRTAPQQGTYSATVLAYAFEALAALAAQPAEHEKGALLLGAAGVRKSVGMATWAPYRHLNERAELALRTALGDDVFQARLAEGMRMSPGDAMTLASALH